jgi:cellulose biosynthesis protein BcsQ
MDVDFSHFYVPTRLAPGRKLSQEIYSWYRDQLPGCAKTAIRESTQGEESVAMRTSIPEYAPTSVAADEMREFMKELWQMIDKSQETDDAIVTRGRVVEIDVESLEA